MDNLNSETIKRGAEKLKPYWDKYQQYMANPGNPVTRTMRLNKDQTDPKAQAATLGNIDIDISDYWAENQKETPKALDDFQNSIIPMYNDPDIMYLINNAEAGSVN